MADHLPTAGTDVHAIHFDEVMRQSPIGMAVMDFNGRFEAVNPSYCAIYGYTEDALVGENVTLVFPPEQRQRVLDLHQKFLTEGGQLGGEWEVVHRDGTLRHVITNSACIVGLDGQKRRLVYVTDITERRRMERELEASRNFSRMVLDGLPAQLCVLDETGVIVSTNLAWRDFYRLNGGTPGLEFEGISYLAVCDRAAHGPGPVNPEVTRFCDLLKEVLDGQRDGFEVSNTCHPPDEKRWFQVRVSRLKGSDPVRVVVAHDDVTELVLAREQMRLSEARWHFAIEGAGDGLWDWNVQTGEAFFSPRYREMLGFAENEFEGNASDWMRLMHPDDAPNVMATMRPYLDGKPGSVSVEFRMVCKDGSWKWILGRGMVVSQTDDGKALRMIGTNSDITERKHLEAQVQQLAYLDPLTGLPNRRLLYDRLGQRMASSKRSARYGALMVLDLDNFKPLNDQHGHLVGDLLLKEVARRLTASVREVDSVARFGGDEFVVMLGELDVDLSESMSEARHIAEKIRVSLADPYVLPVLRNEPAASTVQHRCTASIGMALFVNHEISQEEVIAQADAAMYQAKDAGRNAIRFYEGLPP